MRKTFVIMPIGILFVAIVYGLTGYGVGYELGHDSGYRQAMEHAKQYYIETGELPSQTWIDWSLRTRFDGDIRQSITAD